MPFTLRHPSSKGELAALLRYRADAMLRTGLAPVMGCVHEGMEYDAHDAWCEQFGVYQITDRQERLVGCVRIIGHTATPLTKNLLALVPLEAETSAPPLPFRSIPGIHGKSDLPLDGAVEVGRMLTDAHLGTAFLGLLHALCAVGFLVRGHRHAYVVCGERLARLYQRFGFEDHGEVDLPLPNRSRLVGLHRMPADEWLHGMAAEFQHLGRIVFA